MRAGLRIALPLFIVLGALIAFVLVLSDDDEKSALTIVGTSDVFDSNLVQAVLKPGFEDAYPDYKLNYISKGTGAAIELAEAGGADALIVHSAKLESQFVAAGFSAEPQGRAIFWGDYVLLGPQSDPAGVAADTPHDIVGAFERIAAAGAKGAATFVSRGGTPGTTVKEHALWDLAKGITGCTVGDADGGGITPSTARGDCPSAVRYPSWYKATGLTQGPNIVAGDACNFPNGGCYVFTDRGTFRYLKSTGALSQLKIVVRDNDPSARGAAKALVNLFNAYAVNEDRFGGKSNVDLNTQAAKAFLDWVVSPKAQAAVGAFLDDGGDPPFVPCRPAPPAKPPAQCRPAG